MPQSIELDRFDRQILARLQSDTRVIAAEIGAEIGLSTAAVQRRIKRLRETGVIAREVAVLDPAALGMPMTFIISIELENERVDLLDRLRRDLRADDHVQQCYTVTGTTDFLLIVAARDMADFEAFTRRTLYDRACIRRFTTNVVMDRVKLGLALPIDET